MDERFTETPKISLNTQIDQSLLKGFMKQKIDRVGHFSREITGRRITNYYLATQGGEGSFSVMKFNADMETSKILCSDSNSRASSNFPRYRSIRRSQRIDSTPIHPENKVTEIDKKAQVSKRYTKTNPSVRRTIQQEIWKNSFRLVPRNFPYPSSCNRCMSKNGCYSCKTKKFEYETIIKSV